MFRAKRINTERSIRYATAANFVEVYNEEMHSLYLLSILLTADLEKAEQCFVSALDECIHGIDVFMEWARLWARRAIIKQAVKLIAPAPGKPIQTSVTSIQWNSKSINGNFIGAIFSLGTFERFVFVMSLLERQSDEDCSVLLNCRRRDIESARGEAMKILSDTDTDCNTFEESIQAWWIIYARKSMYQAPLGSRTWVELKTATPAQDDRMGRSSDESDRHIRNFLSALPSLV
jgi:hypothetical protein